MTILEFVKAFPRCRMKLDFNHVDAEGNLEHDEEYSYVGSTDRFEERMWDYDWLFDIELSDPSVLRVSASRITRKVEIRIEYEH